MISNSNTITHWQFRLFPDREAIVPITVDAITGELVLCFGLIECKPPINADVLVFDPQAGHRARPPSVNEYKFSRLAIVANFKEICSMLFTPMAPDGHMHSPSSAGESLRKQEGCEVVVVKNGVEGATVVTAERTAHVPSVRTESVFPIGSGDVFSGVFATHWAALGKDPVDAASRFGIDGSLLQQSRVADPIGFAGNRGGRTKTVHRSPFGSSCASVSCWTCVHTHAALAAK